MNRKDRIVLDSLEKKITQHEETIVQLLRIVASTNKKMTELATDHHPKTASYKVSSP